jgi:hypothetical protein
MMLTYDRGIVDRIIERRGLPFDENAEPCVVQVVQLDYRYAEGKPWYGVIFEGEDESETGVIVWAAE